MTEHLLLFDVTPLDPATFLLAPEVRAGIAKLSTYLTARRTLPLDSDGSVARGTG